MSATPVVVRKQHKYAKITMKRVIPVLQSEVEFFSHGEFDCIELKKDRESLRMDRKFGVDFIYTSGKTGKKYRIGSRLEIPQIKKRWKRFTIRTERYMGYQRSKHDIEYDKLKRAHEDGTILLDYIIQSNIIGDSFLDIGITNQTSLMSIALHLREVEKISDELNPNNNDGSFSYYMVIGWDKFKEFNKDLLTISVPLPYSKRIATF